MNTLNNNESLQDAKDGANQLLEKIRLSICNGDKDLTERTLKELEVYARDFGPTYGFKENFRRIREFTKRRSRDPDPKGCALHGCASLSVIIDARMFRM